MTTTLTGAGRATGPTARTNGNAAGDPDALEPATRTRAKVLARPIATLSALWEERRDAARTANGMARREAASRALADASDADEVLAETVRHARAVLGARYGLVALVTDDASLELVRVAGLARDGLAVWPRLPIHRATALCDAARSGEPSFVESIDANDDAAGVAALLGVNDTRAFAAIPLIAHGRVLAVLGLCFAVARRFVEEDRALLVSLGVQAGQALDHARRHQLEKEERALAAFLADASIDLDSSLESSRTLDCAARLAVPFLADGCAIDVVSADGAVTRGAAAHGDPSVQGALMRASRPGDVLSVRAALAGEAQLVALVRAGDADIAATGPFDAAGAPPASSYMVVPLRARGRVLGAITLVSESRSRIYGRSDIALAQNLAQRAALALDNARLYEQAESAVRARDDVLAVVSHDLRNPLGVVRAVVQTLRRTVATAASDLAPRVDVHCGAIVRATDRMCVLIDDLLDFARIESGRLRITPAPCDVRAVVDEAIIALEPLAAQKRISLTLDLPPHDCTAPVDRARIVQVLANLVGNAVKFVAPGGHIAIAVTAAASHVAVTVTDDGPGIAAHQVPHVFERYFQAESTQRLGTGLGLAIVKGLVEAHGGGVSVSSVLGEGASFTFVLPRGEGAAAREEGYDPRN
jgi:signal transduction histidine kinase